MTTIRIRTFTVLSLFLILLLPWIFYVASYFLQTSSISFSSRDSQESIYPFPMIAATIGLLLAFFIVGMQMRRFILQPLEKMGLAARQIADGELDVQIPMTRISEIAQVSEGFTVMVNGLRQAHEKQIQLEEERRFVIAAVAHDLRTPLFALRGYLDGLAQGIANSPEQIAKYVAVCREKSAQLDRLVEELFAFAKLEYVDSRLDVKLLDLQIIMQKSVESLRPLAQKKNIEITSDTRISEAIADGQNASVTGHCTINGDEHLLERSLSNLLDNAVRHTPVGGEIKVQCYREAEKVKFTIEDTGPGFLADELKSVFEPLYRGEQSRNRATGGSGLGLTISQRVISKHGGQLEVSNALAGGALLRGWLPAAEQKE